MDADLVTRLRDWNGDETCDRCASAEYLIEQVIDELERLQGLVDGYEGTLDMLASEHRDALRWRTLMELIKSGHACVSILGIARGSDEASRLIDHIDAAIEREQGEKT